MGIGLLVPGWFGARIGVYVLSLAWSIIGCPPSLGPGVTDVNAGRIRPGMEPSANEQGSLALIVRTGSHVGDYAGVRSATRATACALG